MSDPIFERYKEALKQGHVAVLRGRHKEALEHYRTAVEIADERPLPHTSLGGVLLRLGRTEEALASYARALGRAPRDEGALNGRAEALLAADRRSEAAEVLERLADVLASTDRQPEALAILGRALGLAETKRRRRRYTQLARALRIDEPEAEAAEPSGLQPAEAEPPAVGAAVAEEPDGATHAEPAAAVTAGSAEAVAGSAEAAGSVAAQPADPEQVLDEAEHARYQGRVDDALAGYVAAAESYLAAGATDAALDACQRGLRAAPDAASVHLTLAKVYLARGWRERAVEKLLLLDRLLELDGAVEARRELSELARQHVAAEPGLEPLAAGTTGRDGPDPGAAPPPG